MYRAAFDHSLHEHKTNFILEDPGCQTEYGQENDGGSAGAARGKIPADVDRKRIGGPIAERGIPCGIVYRAIWR